MPQKTVCSEIDFWVYGEPIPQGTMSAARDTPVRLYYTNAKKLYPWRDQIAEQAKSAGVEALEGPVEVQAFFYFPHPKDHYRGKNVNNALLAKWKKAGVDYHTQKPDLDKLIRAVLDALKEYAFQDDAQVASIGGCTKVWSDKEPRIREAGGAVRIVIRKLEANHYKP